MSMRIERQSDQALNPVRIACMHENELTNNMTVLSCVGALLLNVDAKRIFVVAKVFLYLFGVPMHVFIPLLMTSTISQSPRKHGKYATKALPVTRTT